MRHGATQERKLRDIARHIWQAAATIDGPLPKAAPESGLGRFRNAAKYQRGMQFFKWRVLPDWVFLPVILFVALWLAVGGITQTYLPWLESGTALCTSKGDNLAALSTYTGVFDPAATCHAVGQRVEPDKRYRVELRVTEPWFDGRHATNPAGLTALGLGPFGVLFGPLRRVVEANYLQPVIAIRQPAGARWFDNVDINPLVVAEQEPGLFAGEFKAPDGGGELFVFANDAVSLLDPTYFYSGPGKNSGRADLKIVLLEEAPNASMAKPKVQARAGH